MTAIESREEMEERYLKMLRLIQSKAIETLANTSLGSAFEAVRSLGLTIREERVIRGEPGDRTAISIEDTIRREMDRWLVRTDEGDE